MILPERNGGPSKGFPRPDMSYNEESNYLNMDKKIPWGLARGRRDFIINMNLLSMVWDNPRPCFVPCHGSCKLACNFSYIEPHTLRAWGIPGNSSSHTKAC